VSKYRLTIRSGSGKPFIRDFEADGVGFETWWAVLERLFDEDGEPIQPQVIAAVSSDHLLCLEELEP